jgi:predicted metal-dependent hydrolase
MNDFISIIIATIVLISIFMYYETKYSELTYVKSNIDNEDYLVRNREDKNKAADLLANIKKNLLKLVEVCEQSYSDDKRVHRLVNKFKPEKISESLSSSKHTSYSVNKGEKIVFCIRTKDKKQKLIKTNTMMFVAIHELAHVMTESIGHTDEFWENMRFLLKVAIKNGLYKKQNFQKKPEPYCGTTITDTPLRE